MPRIDRYILSQMTALFGFFALVLISIYWLNRSVLLFEQLIADGQTALVVVEFTALTLPSVIALVLPVAGFVASAYGTNRLAGESELVAMQAAGMSPWRLARPVLVFGLMVGLMVAILVHALVPLSRAELAARQDAVAEDVAARFLRAGSFQFPSRGVTLFIREITPDGTMKDLLFDDARQPERETIYTAEEAVIARTDQGPRLVMRHGSAEELQRGGHDGDDHGRLALTRFSELTFDISGMIGAGNRAGTDLRDYSTLRLLQAEPEMLTATGATPARARLTAHQRLAQPLIAPVAAVLGFALLLGGGYSRFGLGRQIAASVLALIALEFAGTAASAAAVRNPASWPIVYLPALAGALACIVVLYLTASQRPRRCIPGPGNGGGSSADGAAAS